MKIEEMMPQKGFFPEYVKYTRTRTDAPDLFHLGTALAMFAAAAARKAMLLGPDGKSKQPIHLWVLLLGPSGDRKSTSIGIGARILAHESKVHADAFPLLTIGRSPEATLDVLAETPHGLLLYPEATALFSAMRKPWWANAEGLLPTVYDGKTMKRVLVGPRRGRKEKLGPHGRVEIVVENPRVCFLGGASPDALDAAISKRDQVGGLLGRMLPLYADRDRYNPCSQEVDETAARRLRTLYWQFIIDRRVSSDGSGVVRFTAHAWEQYKHWTRRTLYEGRNFAVDKRAMVARLTGHILRVAAIYRIGAPAEVTDEQVMGAACALGEVAKNSLLKLPPAHSK